MCARYTVFSEEEIMEMRAIIAEISKKFGDSAINKQDIFPSNNAPILMTDRNGVTPYPASWGFPKWDGKGVIYNARSESALQKPMFAKPLLTRRCVVPSTGFYEWALESAVKQQSPLPVTEQRAGKKEAKVKLFFQNPDSPMLYMAGMVQTYPDKDGAPRDTFVILTTAANPSMAPFHNRMPVILSANEREPWLNSDSFMREVITRVGPPLAWGTGARCQ